MYYSKHNNNITYFFTWGKPLQIEGQGEIYKEDTDIGKDENWTQEYTYLHIKDGITAINKGFLEAFCNLKNLIIDRSVKRIAMTDKLKAMLKNNSVTIRGNYNSYGEKFAEENNLLFIHKDIYLAIWRNEEHCEARTVTLHFTESGNMELLYEDFCQGISAGNTMGGTFTRNMPKEFHKGCTIEEFADMMPEIYFDQIIKNKELKEFLESYTNRKEK